MQTSKDIQELEAQDRNTSNVDQASNETLTTADSVLQTAPGQIKWRSAAYTNLTPWVLKFFFIHTYYAYIYVFYMFVLAFYKGYALEYPEWRRWFEMVLIMVIPALQHLRFYFGYWGCELGMSSDITIFLLLCSVVMFVLMYFLFLQAYIMPLDSTFLVAAVVAVAVEGVCGAVNALQTLKLHSSSILSFVMLTWGIVLLLIAVVLFVVRQLLPQETMVEELVDSNLYSAGMRIKSLIET